MEEVTFDQRFKRCISVYDSHYKGEKQLRTCSLQAQNRQGNGHSFIYCPCSQAVDSLKFEKASHISLVVS